MIILRQKLYSDKSGRFWAGTKGALKGAGKGALIGVALMPGKLRALKKEKYKLAGGLAIAGATIGAGIGGRSGWKKGVNDYKYNNDLEYRAKIDKENRERTLKALENAKDTDKLFISEMNYQGWINLSKKLPVPEEFMKYLKFYNSYWAKKVDLWYSSMVSDLNNYMIPEFKNLFPIPVDPQDSEEWYEDGLDMEEKYLCLATINDAGDDGWLYYDIETRKYGWDTPIGGYDSLKKLMLEHLDSEEKIYKGKLSDAQSKMVEEFKNKIKALL